MRIAVIVLSNDKPLALATIFPLVLEASFTEILRFPAGFVINPQRETAIRSLATCGTGEVESMTVVPSCSFTMNTAAPAESVSVTFPITNQTPVVPWLMLGPSKKLPVLLRETSPEIAFVIGLNSATKLTWLHTPPTISAIAARS